MFYIGIYDQGKNCSLIVVNMHRKTASRIYEIYACEDDLILSELADRIRYYFGSSDFKTVKKKFSQSGRPPKTEVLSPYFIVCSNNDKIYEDLKEIRVSCSEIVLDNGKKSGGVYSPDKNDVLSALKKAINENRINFNFYKGEEKLNLGVIESASSLGDISSNFKALALVINYTENVRSVKRY